MNRPAVAVHREALAEIGNIYDVGQVQEIVTSSRASRSTWRSPGQVVEVPRRREKDWLQENLCFQPAESSSIAAVRSRDRIMRFASTLRSHAEFHRLGSVRYCSCSNEQHAKSTGRGTSQIHGTNVWRRARLLRRRSAAER